MKNISAVFSLLRGRTFVCLDENVKQLLLFPLQKYLSQ